MEKKIAILKTNIEPLNKPEDWDIFNLPKRIKTASTNNLKDGDTDTFDIKSAIKDHPDHLFLKIFAIREDEINDNGDFFPKAELKKSADSFIGVPIFTNHQNDDIERAKGDCVHAWYDSEAGGIFLIARVDKAAYPRLARGIEEKYIIGSSMGTSVEYSCCSICHKKAHTADDYCEHIKEAKSRTRTGKYVCEYHKSDDKPEDDCPICGCKKSETKHLDHKDQQVFEYNYGLKFIENSFVVNPACNDCGVTCILHAPEVTKKIAELKAQTEKLIKTYDANPKAFTKAASSGTKVAGKLELQMLLSAMDNIEKVAKSMMDQKDHVDMEYVSDLVKAMADVQSTVDELTEMGYEQLPSPTDIEAGSELPIPQEGLPEQAITPVPPPAQQGSVQTTPGPAGTEIQTLEGLGSITKPKISSTFIKNKKESLSRFSKLMRRVSSLLKLSTKLDKKSRSETVTNTYVDVYNDRSDPDSYHVVIDGDFVTEAKGDVVLKVSNISQLSDELQLIIKDDPEKAGKQILENITSTESMMSTKEQKTAQETKTAQVGPNPETKPAQQEVITEKQMANEPPVLHPRTDDVFEQITESKSQIGRDDDKYNDTTSESPQKRLGTYETITEDQMDDITSGYVVRWKATPEVITEKQWTDMSRLASAKLSTDQREIITEKQLRDLLNSHRFVGTYETITENQLKNLDWGMKRWANKSYTNHLLKIATESISDAISNYHKTPEEISGVLAKYDDDDSFKEKIAFLTIVNSLPFKKEERDKLAKNVSYFQKKSSKSIETPDTLDALILSVANNGKVQVKVEDVYDTINHILHQKVAMKKVEKLAEAKLSSEHKETLTTDKFAGLNESIEALDGIEIRATIEEIGADVADKEAFVIACKKFARETTGNETAIVNEIKVAQVPSVVVIRLDLGELINGAEQGLEEPELTIGDELEDIDALQLDEDGETDEEGLTSLDADESCQFASTNKKTKRAEARKNRVKKAQMMGGEMGGQGGMSQAPGAGASLPQPPLGDQMPTETFTAPGTDELGEDADGDLNPKPPGSMCPVCGSSDVDVLAGNTKCNNCGSEMTFKVSVDVSKWADLLGEEKEEKEEGFGEGEGEGFELGEMEENPELPVAAMTKLNPKALQKIAKSKIGLGKVSPLTGLQNTIKISEGNAVDGDYLCLDTGSKYSVELRAPKNGKFAYAQWTWTPKLASATCPSCKRNRDQFVKALASIGVDKDQFNIMDMDDKVKTILELKNAGMLNKIKTASKNGSVIADYKKAYSIYGGEFPLEVCRERLARRYGENALALSGPCEGKPIYECVCDNLKNAGMYTHGLAMKVANIWAEKDGTEDCIEDQIRTRGLDIRQAAVVCSALKTIVAADEDFLTEDLDNFNNGIDGIEEEVSVEEPIVDDFEEDPFESEVGNTISIDADTLVESLSDEDKEKLNTALETTEEAAPTEVLDEAIDETGLPSEEIVDEVPGLPEVPQMEETLPCEEGKEDNNNEELKDDTDLKLIETKPTRTKGVEIGIMASTETEQDHNADETAYMKSAIAGIGKIHMDLDSVAATLLGKEASEKEIRQELAQEEPNVKQISEGTPASGKTVGTMGHEDETIRDAAHPKVPRNEATMGQEPAEINPQDKPLPIIPSDKGSMGHEELEGGDVRFTGGADGTTSPGAGQAETEKDASDEEEKLAKELALMKGAVSNSRERINSLAERIIEAGKLEPKKPVADDEDIQPVKDNTSIGHEPEFSADTPENTEDSGDGAMMGHEKETLKSTPKSPKDHPEIPEDDARMGHEVLAPEKQLRDKGTVIARSDEESEVQKQAEAFRVAGLMLEKEIITASELQVKVNELAKYELGQIKDYAKAIFANHKTAKKGLDTASEGLEQALVINETSSQRDGTNELAAKLQTLFYLDKQNKEALENPDFSVRKAFGM